MRNANKSPSDIEYSTGQPTELGQDKDGLISEDSVPNVFIDTF